MGRGVIEISFCENKYRIKILMLKNCWFVLWSYLLIYYFPLVLVIISKFRYKSYQFSEKYTLLFNDLYFPTSCLRDRWARSVGNLKQSLPFCVIHIVMDTNGLIKHAFIVVCSSIWCTDWKVYSSTQYLTSTSELQFFIYRMTLHLDKLVLKSKTL